MNKKISKIKRVLVLCLIFLFSINSFAAIVSDNDGSAFVTKAEFDALKTDFNKQIDDYNKSIDGKIDGAIASYLAGLARSKYEHKNIVCADWKYLECVNSDLKNQIEVPTLNLQIIYNTLFGPSSGWYDSFFVKFDGNNLATVTPSKINVIEGITVNNSLKSVDTTNAYWCGTSQDVRNEINFKGIWNVEDHTSAGNATTAGYKCQCNRLVKWRWYNGWKTNFNTATDPIFKPQMWRYSKNAAAGGAYGWLCLTGHTGWETATEMEDYTSVIEKIDVSYDLANIKHTHILSWTKDRSFETINSNLNCYNKVSKYQTKTSADVIADGVLTWNNWADIYWLNSTNKTFNFERNIAMEVKDTEGIPSAATELKQKIPTVGLLPTDLKASEIYQWDVNIKKGESEHPIEKKRLHEGMPLIYVNKDEEIIWEPNFSLTFDNPADSVSELYIEAAYVPFGDKNSNTEKIDLDKISSETRVKTIGKTGNVRFKAEKSGYIWVKWYPAYTNATDIDNKAWIATLDIVSNPEVTVIKPE